MKQVQLFFLRMLVALLLCAAPAWAPSSLTASAADNGPQMFGY